MAKTNIFCMWQLHLPCIDTFLEDTVINRMLSVMHIYFCKIVNADIYKK